MKKRESWDSWKKKKLQLDRGRHTDLFQQRGLIQWKAKAVPSISQSKHMKMMESTMELVWRLMLQWTWVETGEVCSQMLIWSWEPAQSFKSWEDWRCGVYGQKEKEWFHQWIAEGWGETAGWESWGVLCRDAKDHCQTSLQLSHWNWQWWCNAVFHHQNSSRNTVPWSPWGIQDCQPHPGQWWSSYMDYFEPKLTQMEPRAKF